MCLRPPSRFLCAMIFATLAIIISTHESYGRRRHYTYTYTNNGGGTSSYVKRVAPLVDPESANYPTLPIKYNYDLASSSDVAFEDKLRVFLRVDDKDVVSKTSGRIVAEVKLTDLNDYQTTHVRFVPVSIGPDVENEEFTTAVFDVTNKNGESLIKPSTVYRLFVNLHRESDVYDRDSSIGRLALPYYVATGGETRLQQARQQIVMRTFKDFYYRKNGWRTGERYPMDCYAYYMWATGFCTTGAENGRTKLNKLFTSDIPYHNGSRIPTISTQNPIHGDYVRKPGHSFMLLSYDPTKKHVWCMEGNFNSTVEVVVRSVSLSWQVGHLRDGHIRPDVFPIHGLSVRTN